LKQNRPIPYQRLDLGQWKILVVDDEPDNLLLVEITLGLQGATIYTALSAQEGLALLPTIQPTFILLDIAMPRMDGYEMLKQLRLRPDTVHLPIIALTAHVQSDDRARVLNAGFNGHISKPFEVTLLATHIQEILDQTSNTQGDSHEAAVS